MQWLRYMGLVIFWPSVWLKRVDSPAKVTWDPTSVENHEETTNWCRNSLYETCFPACKDQFFQHQIPPKSEGLSLSIRQTEAHQIDLNAQCTSAEEFAHDFQLQIYSDYIAIGDQHKFNLIMIMVQWKMNQRLQGRLNACWRCPLAHSFYLAIGE